METAMNTWSPLTMTYTDGVRIIGKIEEVERRDRWGGPDDTVTKYSATYFWPSGYRVGADYSTWEDARAMIEKFAREEQRDELHVAAE